LRISGDGDVDLLLTQGLEQTLFDAQFVPVSQLRRQDEKVDVAPPGVIFCAGSEKVDAGALVMPVNTVPDRSHFVWLEAHEMAQYLSFFVRRSWFFVLRSKKTMGKRPGNGRKENLTDI
jgi:hypothetical protein